MLFEKQIIYPQWIHNNELKEGAVYCLLANENNIFAGTDTAGVFLSTNNGTNWIQVNSGLPHSSILSLAVKNTNIFAGTNGYGVFVSSDNGTNWTSVSDNLSGLTITALVVSKTNIFAATPNRGVYISTNDGINWTQVINGLPKTIIYRLAVSENNIYAGTLGYGVFFSSDNGTMWNQSGLTSSDVRSLTVAGTNIFAGTSTQGIFLSTDNGISFIHSDNGPAGTDIYSLTAVGNYLFAGTDNKGVYFSTDDGTNWTQTNDHLPSSSVYSLSGCGTNIVAGTDGTGIWIRPIVDFFVPVELYSFTANFINGVILLNWKTATELNNMGFNIERSTNKSDWVKITFVQGNQNSTVTISYSYLDKSIINPGKYYYRLKQIDDDGSFKYSDILEVNFITLSEYTLSQNYPNPFNPNTKINYSLPFESNVIIGIYDVNGRKIKQLVYEEQLAGNYTIDFNESLFNNNLCSGVYFYRMTATSKSNENHFTSIKKMILLK
jgi:photosystem II stability/assembly factor-like uncharacterized protein